MRESRSPSRSADDLSESLSITLPDEQISLDCEIWGDVNQQFGSEDVDEDSIDSSLEDDEG